MVFSSYTFILLFLPIVILGIFFLKDLKRDKRLIFLSVSSLFFYAYWDWHFLWVILLSIFGNYYFGYLIFKNNSFLANKKSLLFFGILLNIILLGYFKYTNFFIDNINFILNTSYSSLSIILPLGISFFTFQQIAYLVDTYQKKVTDHNFSHYLLFVSFFPQLIAGPIVHHKETLTQFANGRGGSISRTMFTQGLSIFVIGLLKKVLIADNIAAMYSTPVFEASNSMPIPFIESWCGILAYSFQIYFDFSAYSDMAIGLGLMFGVRLPINFYSPYKATNIIDFWKRWHITLSRFLRDYLYIPLGGNKLGKFRTHFNIMLVMLLGGLWHGSNWNFVIWGGLHGIAIVLNHIWRDYRTNNKLKIRFSIPFHDWCGRIATFLFITILWVFFRCDNLDASMNIIHGLLGFNGIILPETYYSYLGTFGQTFKNLGVEFSTGYLFLGVKEIFMLSFMLGIVWFLPNTAQFFRYREYSTSKKYKSGNVIGIKWRPNYIWAFSLSITTIICLVFISNTGEFLYFQF